MIQNLSLKDPENIFLFIYLPVKIIALIILFFFLFNTKQQYALLSYPDFTRYTNCFSNFDNILFGLTACALKIKDTSNFLPIVITLIITLIRDFLYLKFATKLIKNNKIIIIFALLLAFHPYLVIYNLKFSTDLFGSLGILLIFYQITYNKNSLRLFFITLVLVYFRNNLIVVFSLYYLTNLVVSYLDSSQIKFKENLLYLIILLFCWLSLSNSVYLQTSNMGLVFDSRWPFSLPNHLNFFGLENNLISNAIGLFTMFISHLILLTGFRESVFLFGFEALFLNGLYFGIVQTIVSLILATVHILGMVYFNIFSTNKKYLIVLAYVFPTFLALSHLRYFYPLIPIALLGLSILINKLVSK